MGILCILAVLRATRAARRRARPAAAANSVFGVFALEAFICVLPQNGHRAGIIIHRPGIGQRSVNRKIHRAALNRHTTSARGTSCPPCRTRAATRRNAIREDCNRKKRISITYPSVFNRFNRARWVIPLSVVSNEKLTRARASRSSSARNKRPAATAARSGCNGEIPLAIRSAFTKCVTPASFIKNSRAKVVLPAPFGPAMTMHRGFGGRRDSSGSSRDRANER